MNRSGFSRGVALWVSLLAGTASLQGQQAIGPSTGGTAALRQAERMLGHTKRVLMIAAHPAKQLRDW